MKDFKSSNIIPEEESEKYHPVDTIYDERTCEEPQPQSAENSRGFGCDCYLQAEMKEAAIDRLCVAFFRGCLYVFLFILVCGLVYAGYYSELYKKWVQKRAIEIETNVQEHTMGESFSFKSMKLTFTDAKVLNTEGEKASFPDPDKNLVAVKLSGESDGTSGFKNRISDAYIRYGGFCYWQIPNVQCHGLAKNYEIEIFEEWKMTETTKGEGWLIFWLDNGEREFTFCLEERSNGIAYINTVHSINICLEE